MSFGCLDLITIIVIVVNESTVATIITTTTTATETGTTMTSSVNGEGLSGGVGGKDMNFNCMVTVFRHVQLSVNTLHVICMLSSECKY